MTGWKKQLAALGGLPLDNMPLESLPHLKAGIPRASGREREALAELVHLAEQLRPTSWKSAPLAVWS